MGPGTRMASCASWLRSQIQLGTGWARQGWAVTFFLCLVAMTIYARKEKEQRGPDLKASSAVALWLLCPLSSVLRARSFAGCDRGPGPGHDCPPLVLTPVPVALVLISGHKARGFSCHHWSCGHVAGRGQSESKVRVGMDAEDPSAGTAAWTACGHLVTFTLLLYGVSGQNGERSHLHNCPRETVASPHERLPRRDPNWTRPSFVQTTVKPHSGPVRHTRDR